MNKPGNNYFKDDFYSVVQKCKHEHGFKVSITFNKNHWIYSCHFPGRPITPGVCLVQIAKELVSEHYNTAIEISEIKNIKFLHVLGADDSGSITFDVKIDETVPGKINATITITNDSICFAKIAMTLIPTRQ